MRNEVNMYVHYNNSYICMNCLKLNEKKTTSGRFGTVHLWLELCKIITSGLSAGGCTIFLALGGGPLIFDSNYRTK